MKAVTNTVIINKNNRCHHLVALERTLLIFIFIVTVSSKLG
jgi:hypothetical protein